MKQVWVVLRREYLERVKTKGFILATLGVPLLIMGLMAFSIFMGVQSERSEREMAVVDLTGSALAQDVAQGLEAVGYNVEIADPAANTDGLDQRIEDDELEAYLVLDDLTATEGTFVYRAKDSPGRMFSEISRRVVVEAVLSARLDATGDAAGVRQLLGGGEIEYEPVGRRDDSGDPAGAEIDRDVSLVAGMGAAILLYMTTLIYGSYVLRSVLDEKRNRVVEVVISSLRPSQLMLGKVLGVASMGLTQLGIWVAFVGLLAAVGLPLVVANVPGADVSRILEFLPGPGLVLLFLLFFLLGYFLYASLFAAVGAMCSREEDAQQALFPVMMLLVIPFMLQMSTINGNRMAWIDWAALFPFFSPVLMYPRAVAGDVPVWMVALSLVLMAGAIAAMAWVAGRIYRVGILMQGKRPTLKELVRWVREA